MRYEYGRSYYIRHVFAIFVWNIQEDDMSKTIIHKSEDGKTEIHQHPDGEVRIHREGRMVSTHDGGQDGVVVYPEWVENLPDVSRADIKGLMDRHHAMPTVEQTRRSARVQEEIDKRAEIYDMVGNITPGDVGC